MFSSGLKSAVSSSVVPIVFSSSGSFFSRSYKAERTHGSVRDSSPVTGEVSPNKTSNQDSAVRRRLNTKPQSWCHVFGDQPNEPGGRRCVTLLMCDCKHIRVSHQVTSCLRVLLRGLYEARSLFTQLCPKRHQTDFRANKKLL